MAKTMAAAIVWIQDKQLRYEPCDNCEPDEAIGNMAFAADALRQGQRLRIKTVNGNYGRLRDFLAKRDDIKAW